MFVPDPELEKDLSRSLGKPTVGKWTAPEPPESPVKVDESLVKFSKQKKRLMVLGGTRLDRKEP